MKSEPADFFVGLSIFAAAAIVVAGVYWFKAPEQAQYVLYVQYPRVDDLAPRAAVLLQGLTVGRVGAIEPVNTEDGSVVFRVEIAIDGGGARSDTLAVPRGTVATLSYPPLLGPSFIVLEVPPGGGPPLPPGSELIGARAAPAIELLQTIADQVSTEIVATMAVARTLIEQGTTTLEGMDRTMTTTRRELTEALDAVESEITRIEALTLDIQSEITATGVSVRHAVDSTSALISESRRIVADISGMVSRSEPDVQLMLARMDSTTYLLNYFVTQISARPYRVITGISPPPGPP